MIIDLGDDRKMPRVVWKWYYRHLRIRHREAEKAMRDMLIGGIGFVRTTYDGYVNHIRPEVVLWRKA